jgi:hypothetical protein
LRTNACPSASPSAAVGGVRAALPARLQAVSAVERLAVEGEVLVDEGVVEGRRQGVHEVPAQVHLPVGERGLLEELVEGGEEIRRGDVDLLDVGVAELAQVARPLEARRLLLDAGQLEPVIHLVGIAPVHPRHRRLGQRLLDLQHRLRLRGRLGGRRPGERQHLGDVRLVGLAQVGELSVLLQVVVAIGQPQPALVEHADHLGGVLEVLLRAEAEERRRAAEVQARHPRRPGRRRS